MLHVSFKTTQNENAYFSREMINNYKSRQAVLAAGENFISLTLARNSAVFISQTK